MQTVFGTNQMQLLLLKATALVFNHRFVLRPRDQEYMQKIGLLLQLNPYEFDKWCGFQPNSDILGQSIDDEMTELLSLLDQDKTTNFQQKLLLLKGFYLLINNLGKNQQGFTINRGLNREINMTQIALLFPSRLKQVLILQEIEKCQHQTYLHAFDVLSHSLNKELKDQAKIENRRIWELIGMNLAGLSPSRIFKTQTMDLSNKLSNICEQPVEDLQKSLSFINRTFGQSGFQSWQSFYEGNENIEANFSQVYGVQTSSLVAERAKTLLNRIKAQNDDRLPKLDLELIHGSKNTQASHVTICISGFMSQEDNQRPKWMGAVDHFSQFQGDDSVFEPAIFALKWEAQTEKQLVGEVSASIGKTALKGLLTYATGGLTRVAMAIIAAESLIEDKPVMSLFQKARSKAKLTGKLLACALALKIPFKTQTVSLVGFSLGSQVIKSCLKTLDYLYGNPDGSSETVPYDMIHNVTFLAGATHFTKNTSKYKRIFKHLVNGQVKNVYSKGDAILHLFTVSERVLNPLGRNML